jgi:hypothetical protein
VLTHWSLWVRGRVFTRIALADGGDDALAELERGSSLRFRDQADTAEDRDGRRWLVDRDERAITVHCDGGLRAVVADGDLDVGGRRLAWRVAADGSRTARATDADGRRLLDVVPGRGRGTPWAVITVADDLPEPLAVTLAACFELLAVDAAMGTTGLGGGI